MSIPTSSMRDVSSPPITVLDLFCGHGGVGRALDTVYESDAFLGIDIEDYSQTYPGEFIQADLVENPPFTEPTEPIADVVWVSFPCTAYSRLSAIHYGSSEAALEANPQIPSSGIRKLAQSLGKHYIIENVPRATKIGDLETTTRLNGLAFDLPFDMERHFETSFSCPDACIDGEPDVTMSTSGDQSIQDLAAAKNVPASWGKQAVRSAIPAPYVAWLLHHCPETSFPMDTTDVFQ